MAAPSGSQALKDNRPLRERSYQAKMRQDVHTYLNDIGLEISMQALTSMQGKDYRAIFDTLILNLDPFYPFKEGARFEEEFVPALKALRYPFVHQLDAKWLAAVASPHSWPYLLGVLHWLVECCRVRSTGHFCNDTLIWHQTRSEYLVSGHPTIQNPTQVPDEFDDPLDHKALAFQYIEETYTFWLDLQDDFSEWNQIMEERYREYYCPNANADTYRVLEKRNERAQNELDEKTQLLSKLKVEYGKLKSSAVSLRWHTPPSLPTK